MNIIFLKIIFIMLTLSTQAIESSTVLMCSVQRSYYVTINNKKENSVYTVVFNHKGLLTELYVASSTTIDCFEADEVDKKHVLIVNQAQDVLNERLGIAFIKKS